MIGETMVTDLLRKMHGTDTRKTIDRALGLQNIAIWFGIIYFVLIPTVQTMLPASLWFEVHRVDIEDTAFGEDPVMVVDRTINAERPVQGSWTVKVYNATDEDSVCANSGATLYRPEARIKNPIRLFSWWMAAPGQKPENVCLVWPLPPGKYCVLTAWSFYPEGYPRPKVVEAPTACFTVYLPQLSLPRPPRDPSKRSVGRG